MQELVIDIFNRKIMNMPDLKAMFNRLKDGKHFLTIKDYRKRSIPQNAYYWAVVVPLVRRGLYEAGYDEVTDNDEAHGVIKQVHLKRNIVNKGTGDLIEIPGHTSKLTITEFNDFIESVCKWSAEFLNVIIPSPNEQFVEFEEWENEIVETF